MNNSHTPPFTLVTRADDGSREFSSLSELKDAMRRYPTHAGWFVEDATGKTIAGGFMGWDGDWSHGDLTIAEEAQR